MAIREKIAVVLVLLCATLSAQVQSETAGTITTYEAFKVSQVDDIPRGLEYGYKLFLVGKHTYSIVHRKEYWLFTPTEYVELKTLSGTLQYIRDTEVSLRRGAERGH